MKHNLVILSFVAVFALMTSSVFPGNAAVMHINVPFDFYAGNQMLDAGEYIFEMGSSFHAAGSVLTIRTSDGTGICTLITTPDGSAEPSYPSLANFNRYGSRNFLSSVSISGFKARLKMLSIEKEYRAQLGKGENPAVIALN